MPKNEKEEKSSGAKYALWGGIITALIGLIGTGLTIYFQSIYPLKTEERATQTAEARLTAQAGPATFTPTRAAPTDTPLPSTPVPASPTAVPPTDIVSPTPLPPTPTVVVPGVKYCVDTQALNVRTGPGLEYSAVGTLNNNDCLAFDGRAEGSPWVRISPGQPGYLAFGGMWVYGQFLRPQDFEDRLPAVLTPPPPPTPYYSPTPAG